MAEITAATVKELRERTGAGMMDCKKALAETNGEMEAAVDWLRAKGLSAAAKKSSRTAAEGLVGVAVEAWNCEAVNHGGLGGGRGRGASVPSRRSLIGGGDGEDEETDGEGH